MRIYIKMFLNTVTEAVPAPRFTSAPDRLKMDTRISVALIAVAWMKQHDGMEMVIRLHVV